MVVPVNWATHIQHRNCESGHSVIPMFERERGKSMVFTVYAHT